MTGPDPAEPGGETAPAALEPDLDDLRGGGREHALRVLEFPRVLDLVADHASSEQGADHIRELRPASEKEAVRRGLDRVDQMVGFLCVTEGWAPPQIPDARSSLRRLGVEGTVLDGEELVAVGRLLRSSRRARRDLGQEKDRYPRLSELADRLLKEPDAQQRLETSLDETGSVLDRASSRLANLRKDLRSARSDLTSKLESFSRDLPERIRVPDASVTLRGGRYCVPVRREGRSDVGGIVHDESSTGQTLFVEPPFAIEPMNEIRELQAEEAREVQRVLRELTGLVRPLQPDLLASLETLVRVDSLFGRARYALSHGGDTPELGEADERGVYQVVEGYHPLLLAADEPAVPFGLRLASDETVLLVSGPNAGGKTVLLKSIGLLSAMTQAGILPPVGPDTRLPVFREFFAVIGDEQSIEASLSTFSAQVHTLRQILEESGRRDLILLDEVGSHTDPAEGASLAAAVLLRLAGQAGLTAASTHLGDLKALAGEDERVVNASLQFDAERLRPTYRLRRDRPGRSYALEIAERLGLPADVLERARSRLGRSERRMESVLSELEEREQRLEELTRQAEERERRLQDREEALTERARELDRREDEVERAARERAEAYLLDARQEVEEAIERLEEEYGRTGEVAEGGDGGRREEAATRARARVEEAVRRSRKARPEPAPGQEAAEAPDVAPGDRVRIRSLDRRGTVREVRDGEVVVEAGQVRLTLPASDVEPAGGEEGDGGVRSSPGSGGGSPAARPGREAKSEVDLRGLRVAEVERALLPEVDAAVVADLPRFRIIHGKGTGALRKRVRELLEDDPRVSGLRDAEPGEGGRGVTVVEFGGD